MPTPIVGGEEGTSVLKRIGRAFEFLKRGKFKTGVEDFRKPRTAARSRRGDFRRGRRSIQNALGGPPSVL